MIKHIKQWWRDGVAEFWSEVARLRAIEAEKAAKKAAVSGWIYPESALKRQPQGNKKRLIEVQFNNGRRAVTRVKDVSWARSSGPNGVFRWKETGLKWGDGQQ